MTDGDAGGSTAAGEGAAAGSTDSGDDDAGGSTAPGEGAAAVSTDSGDGDAGSTDSAAAGEADPQEGGYSLVWRSVKTAWGSESWLMQSYAVLGGGLAALVAVGVLLALPGWVQSSLGASTTQAVSRAFLLVVGLAVVVPLLAPIVAAGRRHDSGTASRRGDFLLAASGYLFALSLYVAVLVSAPPESREEPPAAIAPVVDVFYGLDPVYGLVPPLVGVAVVVAAVRSR